MAVLGPCVSVNMNGHNNIHSQLTKSLERILEDAYLCGELKLSGRKLKEFPKPVKFDLSDTVLADLSKNQLSELPDEVTGYMFLEKLLLAQNLLRSVPEAVGGLQSLTYLDLSYNQLTELPREICQMPLQVLLLPHNQLTSLPKELGRMGSLAELDASNNRLLQVPMTLGDCASLRALDLSYNQLGLLPLQITYLRLEYLDISCNCISSLPHELRNMSTLVTLRLENNPLVSPPTTVCLKGRVHIFRYLENLANKDSQPRRADDARRATKHNSFLHNTAQGNTQITSGNATIDCLRHRQRHAVDSGYSTDGPDKRWSNDGAGEAGGGSGRSTPSTPSTLSPGAALSRAHSLSGDTPLAPPSHRISPEGIMSNGDEKSKLNHQQTYRQYKEALRQQRQQDVYRPRPDQPSPELDPSPRGSPVHLHTSQSSPHSPVNGYTHTSPSLYSRTVSSNSSINSSPNASQVPNSPLLHSTPRRTQSQNGNIDDMHNKRPVQKVVPSRSVKYSSPNGNGDYAGLNGQANSDPIYIKPTSPTKSPTNTLTYNGMGGKQNGDSAKLTTTVSYMKGGPKPKMSWNKDVAADKLSFTMKREFDKQKEEDDLLQQLRTIIETRLKMQLPECLAPVLADGVVLCHLANHVRPRAVASVHVPSPAQPKLTMARCRRNVDNFLEACRRIGVEEEVICCPEDILDAETLERDGNIARLARTVYALLAHATPSHRPPKDVNQSEATIQHIDQSYDSYSSRDQSHSDYGSREQTHSSEQSYTGDYYENSYQVNYQSNSNRYTEDRYISNFNFTNDYSQSYTFDETEEYQMNYENNNSESAQDVHYSPVYSNTATLRKRGPYYQKNKVQFVMPFCKTDGILRGEDIEIHDTDEVDFPVDMRPAEEEAARYDRGKMNLDIQNNLNTELNKVTDTTVSQEDRLRITCLCLGTFFISALILYFYPL
ncbi:leucine-rich repeat and calponin homology domain-containing protein isoform X2 [Plutella xylostella]|uniref:leucine-rich repeat and calponin homology domain-containing protein isoform X2 n=1 Tax=Plutella xylostella TaxID=51655 RepID=UPI0020326FFC|nr:leucine-rich repeat and calponin homology domain-containing protein isoform X2 [Plutella xylostella]